MAEYRLNPDAFPSLRNRMIARGVFVSLVVFAVVTVTQEQRVNLAFYPIVFGALIAGIYIAIRRARESWHSYSVEIAENGTITRRSVGIADLILSPNDITVIEETVGSGVLIRTKNPMQYIFASCHLIDYSVFVERLQQISPVHRMKASSFAPILVFGSVLGGIVPMYFAMASKDHRLGLAGCLTVIVFLLYCRNRIVSDPNVDERTKKSLLIVHLVIFSMALNAAYRLYSIFS